MGHTKPTSTSWKKSAISMDSELVEVMKQIRRRLTFLIVFGLLIPIGGIIKLLDTWSQ